MLGRILNVQRFCTDDGPGIRTTVFLKGCYLKCVWCHNPETQSGKKELFYDTKKCINCFKCVDVCPKYCHVKGYSHEYNRGNCIACGKCVSVCQTRALEMVGKDLSVEEVVDIVKRDRQFYNNSGGGVTVSGGEPLFQARFTEEILRSCKDIGIHTAVETCGYCKKEDLVSVLRYCDLVLFDIKETDDFMHEKYTGVSLKTVLDNLRTVDESGVEYIIRAPIIPSINDSDRHFEALKQLCSSLKGCKGVQIMPYHKTGSYKYDLLNRKYFCKDIKEPTTDAVERWKNFLSNILIK